MLKGIKCNKKNDNISFKDCLECAKSLDNPCGITYEIINGIISQIVGNEHTPDMINTTAIEPSGCVRKEFLQRTNDFYSSLTDLYFMFRGTIAHKIFEEYAHPNAIIEKGYVRTVAGIKVTGKPDLILPKEGILKDWKTTSSIFYIDKNSQAYENHIEQLNIYRWILAKPDGEEPIDIKKMQIVYLTMKEFRQIEVPILDNKWVEMAVTSQASKLSHAMTTGEVPEVPNDYPNYKLCKNYCPVKDKCSECWKMGQKR